MANEPKIPAHKEFFEIVRRVAADKDGEFFVNGQPRRGAAHRNAYWDGFEGKPCTFPKETLAHAAWLAGRADRDAAA